MQKLQVVSAEKCTGCGLCIICANTILGKFPSLTESPIKVIKNLENETIYSVQIDEAKKTDLLKVAEVCPEGVFEVSEE